MNPGPIIGTFITIWVVLFLLWPTAVIFDRVTLDPVAHAINRTATFLDNLLPNPRRGYVTTYQQPGATTQQNTSNTVPPAPAAPTQTCTHRVYGELDDQGAEWEVTQSTNCQYHKKLMKPAPSAKPGTPGGLRKETGKGNTLPFPAGSPVVGWRIVVNGQTFNDCYFDAAPGPGTVTDGAFGEVYPAERIKACQ